MLKCYDRNYYDGFSDYVDKLITKVEGYIPAFKQLSVSRKIIVILSKILQVANGLLIVKDAAELKKNLKTLKYWGQRIKEAKDKDPNFVPSKGNSYYKNKDLVVQSAISVIMKLIGEVVIIGIEKGAMKQGTKNVTTHDSMQLFKKKYSDKSNKNKEQIKKIERNIEEAKKNVKILKTSKNPKVVKKAQKVDSELDKLIKQLKASARSALISMASLSIALGSMLVISIATEAIFRIITMPFNFLARRAQEREATERFNAWHRQNGPAPRPSGLAPTPLPSDNSRVMNAANGLRNAVSNIQNAVRTLEPSNERAEGGRFGSLDINGNNGAPTSSPGEHGGRFSGLDLDSKYWVTAHDYMPWSRDHRDYGVKGMQKGKHLKAKDDPKQAGGVQKKISSRTAI